MRLATRLILGLSALFLLVLCGVATIYAVNTQGHLQAQLASQSQEAATSLALRLALLPSLADAGPVETTVNPVFDRGYFQEIRVLGPGGETLLAKRDPPAPDSAPGWFVRLLPIAPQAAQAIVSTGWRELGRVVVVSHPHFAYRQLWRASVQMAGWLALLYVAALAGTWAFLALVLKPLRDIEGAARAIAERDFRRIGSVPRAPELARTVEALNSMSQRLQKIIADESASAAALRRQALEDPVTGVFNRRGFASQLQAHFESSGEIVSGALALVAVDNFAPYNARVGYEQGDGFLAQVATRLRGLRSAGAAPLCGRLGGASFALAAFDTGPEDVERLAEEARHDIWQLCAETDPGLACHVGATRWEWAHPEYSALIGAADAALAAAREKGESAWHVTPFDPEVPAGGQAWREHIAHAIDAGQILAFAQDAFSLPAREYLHSEVTARIPRAGGGTIAAAQFLSLAARYDLVARVDLKIVELAVSRLAQRSGPARIAVNISYRTLASQEIVARMLGLLAERPAAASALVFEMTEFGALQDRGRALGFREALRARGAGFALDNFSMLHDGLLLVHALRPDYIKLSRGYVADLERNTDVRFLVDALGRILRPMDIALYALGVEDAAILPLLASHGVTGYQGYAAGEPRPL